MLGPCTSAAQEPHLEALALAGRLMQLPLQHLDLGLRGRVGVG